MHRIAFIVALFVGLSISSTAFATEPVVINLWPGKTPGDWTARAPGCEPQPLRQSHLLPPVPLEEQFAIEQLREIDIR